jgi:hypothetical protein
MKNTHAKRYLSTVMKLCQSRKQEYFRQTQPLYFSLNTTCFDQKLIILSSFNAEFPKQGKNCKLLREISQIK